MTIKVLHQKYEKVDPNFSPTDDKNAIETPFLPFQAPERNWEALS